MNCKSSNKDLKTTISVTSLKRATLDSSSPLTLFQILNTYPANIKCKVNERYANLYICRKFSNGDTVYVFEECTKVDPLAFDTIHHYAAVIDKNKVVMQCPNKFIVFVPANFKIPDDAKYIDAKLDYQTEY